MNKIDKDFGNLNNLSIFCIKITTLFCLINIISIIMIFIPLNLQWIVINEFGERLFFLSCSIVIVIGIIGVMSLIYDLIKLKNKIKKVLK